MSRIWLSPPHMDGDEIDLVRDAFESNWITSLGPHVEAFETEVAEFVGVDHALALASGTAAIHLALRHIGVQPGQPVVCSTLTFAATANPIRYEGGEPCFVDSEPTSWNMDPALLQRTLAGLIDRGKRPAAVITVDIFGQCADYARIAPICDHFEVPLIQDAAEALGATCGSEAAGAFGRAGILSFNGNKIITTSGGGMLVSNDGALIEHARKLATQARDDAPHYQHSEIGFNYRMSNLLAALGRGQFRHLAARVNRRRAIFDAYREGLGDLGGVDFMPEAPWGRSNRWLTCITIDPERFGADREAVRLALAAADIEARPLWKPLHLQPVFQDCSVAGGAVAERLFDHGLCLPSGTAMADADLDRVIEIVRSQAIV